MAIQRNKTMRLKDGQILYNDLRQRIEGTIDDTAGNGDIKVTWSADKITDELSQKGTYSKPATGIPASDLASGVIPDVSGFYTKPAEGIPASDLASGVIPDVSGFYTKPAEGIPASDLASGVIPSVPVQDVQMGGSSVLNNGVANVPLAGEDTVGVVKPYANYGLSLKTNNRLGISPATSAQLKAGDHQYKPIVPNTQDQSVFYGLAKLAGVDLASGSDTVGVYPEAAKVAIQKMLGIYQAPWELIREDTFTNASAASHVITVDGNGQAFELTDIVLVFSTPKQATYSEKGDYGRFSFWYGSGNTERKDVYINAYTQNANAAGHSGIAKLTQNNGLMEVVGLRNGTDSSVSTIIGMNSATKDVSDVSAPVDVISPPIAFNKIEITAVTGTAKYWLYGRRKWN